MSKPRTSSVRALRALVPFLRVYRARVALGLICVIASSAIASAIPWLLRRAINDLKANAPSRDLWLIAATMVGITLVTGVLRFQMRNILNAVSRWVEYDLRNAMFRHLITLDAGFFGRNRTGDLMARLTNDLAAVRMVAGPAIMYLINTIAGGIFALVFMLRISPHLTGVAVLPMVLLPIVMAVLGSLIHKRFEAVQEHFGVMTTHAQENLSGVRIVRAFRQEAAEQAHFARLNDEYLRRNMGLARLYGLMSPGLQLLAGLGAVAVLGIGGSATLRGEITTGDFVAFGLYLGMLTWPLIALGWVINLFQRGAASMSRINEVLHAAPAVVSPPVPTALPVHAQRGRALEFRDVGYHYPVATDGAPRWVLRNISFTVPAGATIGIVGATGSGKSALMDLIPRFWDPQEGAILLDGVAIASLELTALRSTIGYVPQESLLFSDTILANLTYGGNDEESARVAAGVAQLNTAIGDLPNGYDTLLGERGINLSGGQKQRAAIARALARNPQIVLLDDALSAVDTGTEAAILQGLRDELTGRTALIASHRVSAVRDASWIIVLDEGRIVEQGTHDTLVATRGRYWQLLRRQQVSDELDAAVVA
jgi:ATP-binding cassette, subfamily B, multidrug efflux pump